MNRLYFSTKNVSKRLLNIKVLQCDKCDAFFVVQHISIIAKHLKISLLNVIMRFMKIAFLTTV